MIIGKNGSGKSTLLNIISMYALCDKSMCSEMPDEALDFPPIFDDDDKVLDGIDISSDYIGKVFRLLPSTETNRDSVLKNISNFDLYANSIQKSYGEKVVLSLESLFNLMFNQKDYAFPMQDLAEYKKKSNAFWIKRIDNLLKYYRRNCITLTESSFEYTVLMDEPDRNLDIDNIMQIHKEVDADDYVLRKDNCCEDFMAGAEWRINSVWYDAREKPDKGKLLIVEDIDGAYDLVYSTKSKPWEELSEKNHYMRWAYVEDLIP